MDLIFAAPGIWSLDGSPLNGHARLESVGKSTAPPCPRRRQLSVRRNKLRGGSIFRHPALRSYQNEAFGITSESSKGISFDKSGCNVERLSRGKPRPIGALPRKRPRTNDALGITVGSRKGISFVKLGFNFDGLSLAKARPIGALPRYDAPIWLGAPPYSRGDPPNPIGAMPSELQSNLEKEPLC